MKRVLAACGVMAILAGCASTSEMQISEQNATDMSGKKLLITTRPVDKFELYGAYSRQEGIIPMIFRQGEGQRVLEKNNIGDPAENIANQLGNAVSKKFDVQISAFKPITDSTRSEVALTEKKMDYVLEVSTQYWSIDTVGAPYMDKKEGVDYYYYALGQLIDVKSHQIIAKHYCYDAIPKAKDALVKSNYGELLNDGAEGLKKRIAMSVDFCVNDLGKSMFGL